MCGEVPCQYCSLDGCCEPNRDGNNCAIKNEEPLCQGTYCTHDGDAWDCPGGGGDRVIHDILLPVLHLSCSYFLHDGEQFLC